MEPAPIYVVDGDAALRTAVVRTLTRAGHATRAYASGDAFLAALPGLPPGCIICDHDPETVDGFAVLAAVAGRRAELPVLMMVFLGDLETAVGAMRQGAADVLEKPLTAPALLDGAAMALARANRAHGDRHEPARARLRLQAMTGEEDRVLRGLAAGLTPAALAEQSQVSLRTIERRSRRMVVRLGVGSVADAVDLFNTAETGCDETVSAQR